VYRDDTCAVCGESLPPDHFYCREHAATVDDRLHEIGRLLPQVAADVLELGRLLDGIAQETWDYLAEQHDDDPEWPPRPSVLMPADADDVNVEVFESIPGTVRLELTVPTAMALQAVAAALAADDWQRLADVAANATETNATH
jgi:hypothetical protein